MTRTGNPYRMVAYGKKIPGMRNSVTGVAPLMTSARSGESTISNKAGFQYRLITEPTPEPPRSLRKPAG